MTGTARMMGWPNLRVLPASFRSPLAMIGFTGCEEVEEFLEDGDMNPTRSLKNEPPPGAFLVIEARCPPLLVARVVVGLQAPASV